MRRCSRRSAAQPWWAGVFWWSWWTDKGVYAPLDFAIKGKLAESVLRNWWAPARASTKLTNTRDQASLVDQMIDSHSRTAHHVAEGIPSDSAAQACTDCPEGATGVRYWNRAYDLGIRHFDVAPIYGLGIAEAELADFAQIAYRYTDRDEIRHQADRNRSASPGSSSHRSAGCCRCLPL